MRLLATIALGLAYMSFPLNAAEPSANATGRETRPKIALSASPLDWGSKDVRIEINGGQTRVIVRRETFKGIRQVNVKYEMDDANSSVTLIYRVSTLVGPITSRGLNFERSDLDVAWIFDTKQFEKMKAERKFFILCEGEGAEIG
jgi:hypothetical protein